MKNSLIFSRRAFIILLFKLSFLIVLICRFFYLQIRQSSKYINLAEQNRTNLVPIIPLRGTIFDTENIALTNNIFLWETLFIKSQIKDDINIFISNISSIINLNESEKERILYDYNNKPAYYPILIKQDISQREIAGISTFFYKIPGVFIRPFYKRYYPYNNAMSHLIGYTSLSDDKVKSKNIPDWHLGKYGIELSLDNFLKGSPGYSKYEVNAKGNVLRQLDQSKSEPGNNIHLTIDANLQNDIHKLLSRYNSASVTISHIPSGNILALTSYPSFDPNIFTERIGQKYWDELINNEKSPLVNKPLAGLYPPASTIKPIIILLALEKGIIDKETVFFCKGYLDIGKDRFHCWKKKGHGEVNAAKSLVESCDIFYYSLARLIDIKDVEKACRYFGYGSKHMSLLNEYTGKTPLTNNQNDNQFTLGDKIVASIGQGYWSVTPIQLLKQITLFANLGKNNTFNLLKSIEYNNKIVYVKPNKSSQKSIPYSKENIEFVKQTFYDTINSPNGTGSNAKTFIEGWELSGKTGTAQVRRISMKERQTGIIPNHLLPWKLRDHALFIGFVPFENPTYAMSIVIEHGGGSSAVATPLAREISILLHQRHESLEKSNSYTKDI